MAVSAQHHACVLRLKTLMVKVTTRSTFSAQTATGLCFCITPQAVTDQMEVSTTGSTSEHHQQSGESNYYLINQSSH